MLDGLNPRRQHIPDRSRPNCVLTSRRSRCGAGSVGVTLSEPENSQNPGAVALDAFEAAFRAAIRQPLEELVRALLADRPAGPDPLSPGEAGD